MERRVDDRELGQLARRQHDLFRQVSSGALPVGVIKRGIQLMIDSRLDELGLAYKVTIPAGWEMPQFLGKAKFDSVDPAVSRVRILPYREDTQYWCSFLSWPNAVDTETVEARMRDQETDLRRTIALMALAGDYPDLQRDSLITHLDPIATLGGVPHVFVLLGDKDFRRCMLVPHCQQWPPKTRFLYIESMRT